MDIRLAILLRLLVLINQLVFCVHLLLQVPNVMTATYGQRTFSYCAPKCLNLLKMSKIVTIFKNKVQTFIFRDFF